MGTILYALVASAEGIPLAEYHASSSTHGENAKKVLASIKGAILERKCLGYNGYSYDILPHRDGTVYMSVTEDSCNRAISFRFLDAARRRCHAHRGNPVALASELKKEVDFFNDTQRTKICEIRSEIAQVKEEMVRNVDKLMYRSDRLDTLLIKSSALEDESSLFRQNARELKRQLLCRRILLCTVVAVIVIGLIFVLVLSICSKDGVNFHRCSGGS
ncbi:putative vesicle-associated membrane protein 713 [Trypanosoma theileri]|uniref:Putative vesicle-associated membrane protein 713 n=1 Tax=Trypanosoma theileri TaxID=67003 RepID=A0A1X0P780_9TRYP|nr:putative vesicle-associated membrane protein 713 [Trypanosoma theileri]ORC92782.1 putative vesicle-associated membrane protein 713 [Trypanosoma theileri]